MKMRPIITNVTAVCVSYKNGLPDWRAIWDMYSMDMDGPEEAYVTWERGFSRGKEQFWGDISQPIVMYDVRNLWC